VNITELTIAGIIRLIIADIREVTVRYITRHIGVFITRLIIEVITEAIIAAIIRLYDVLTVAVLFAATREALIAVIKGDMPPEDM